VRKKNKKSGKKISRPKSRQESRQDEASIDTSELEKIAISLGVDIEERSKSSPLVNLSPHEVKKSAAPTTATYYVTSTIQDTKTVYTPNPKSTSSQAKDEITTLAKLVQDHTKTAKDKSKDKKTKTPQKKLQLGQDKRLIQRTKGKNSSKNKQTAPVVGDPWQSSKKNKSSIKQKTAKKLKKAQKQLLSELKLFKFLKELKKKKS